MSERTFARPGDARNVFTQVFANSILTFKIRHAHGRLLEETSITARSERKGLKAGFAKGGAR